MSDKIRAEEESKTVVSTFYPNQIEEGWACTYTIYAPDIEQRILQWLTIIKNNRETKIKFFYVNLINRLNLKIFCLETAPIKI